MGEVAGAGSATERGSSFGDMLLRCQALLSNLVGQRARGLLIHESREDLIQGIYAHALAVADRFEYRSEPELRGWVARVALQHFADRAAYWKSKRRDAAMLLRLDSRGHDSGSTPAPWEPQAAGPGPATLAILREEVLISAKGLSLLLPRDQRIMSLVATECSVGEIARDQEISPDAAQQARARALARFRRVTRLLGLGSRSERR